MSGDAKTYGDVLLTLMDVAGGADGGGATRVEIRVDNPKLRCLVLHSELFAIGPRGSPGAYFGSVQIELPEGLSVIEAATLVEFRGQSTKIGLAAGDQRMAALELPCAPPGNDVFINLVARDREQFVFYAYAVPLRFFSGPKHKHERFVDAFRNDSHEASLRIYQPNLVGRDAVGNFAWALADLAHNSDVPVQLYAEVTDYENFGVVKKASDLFRDTKEDDVIFVNFSTRDPFIERISRMSNPKIAYFHNITPGEYFRGYSAEAKIACDEGWEQLENLRRFDTIFANSHFTADCINAVFNDRTVVVVPPVIYDQSNILPIEQRVRGRGGHEKKILFVGRIVPNKKIESLLEVVAKLEAISPGWRLTLVGSTDLGVYMDELHRKVAAYNLNGAVEFCGSVGQEALEDMFSRHRIFLCLSEHEGFCVPVLEAMQRGLVVVALRTSALGELIRDSLDLFQLATADNIAEAVHKIANDEALYKQIVDAQREIAADLFRKSAGHELIDCIKSMI